MSFSAKDILEMEMAPALGCTEPAAISLAAAAAASILPERVIDRIELWVDPNIYKNGLAVVIPGTSELRGLENAAALGALGGDPFLALEVLAPIDDEIVARVREFVSPQTVKVHLLSDERGLLIRTLISSGEDTGESIIEDLHSNISALKLNGRELSDHPLVSRVSDKGKGRLSELEAWLKSLSLEELLALLDDLDSEDLAFLAESVRCNLRLAEYGLKHGSGLGVGKALDRLAEQGLIKRDMILGARILSAAAADARMAGAKLPAMASAGSGNHGLIAVLPIRAVQDHVDGNERSFLEAIGLSQIITAYVKAHTGRLSAVCGCSIAAGAGAAAGITYLLGGTVHHIAGAVKNLTEDLAGVICDGAKAGCALKLATTAGTAVQASLLALEGISVQATDGIIGVSLEQTTRNIGELSTQGMIEADRTILRIMLQKRLPGCSPDPT